MGRETARRARVVEQHNPARRAIFQRDHRAPDSARPEHPQKSQEVAARARPVPLAHLPDVWIETPAAPHLASALSPVRPGPVPRWGNSNSGLFPYEVPPGAKENQDRLAGPWLWDCQGGARPLAVQAAYFAGTTAPRGLAGRGPSGRRKGRSCRHRPGTSHGELQRSGGRHSR